MPSVSGQATNYQVNAANALILTTPPSGAPTTSTFDANRNLTLENTGGALTTYQWDSENRLLAFADGTGMENYSYSADGLRQKKVVGTSTTNFVWDNQNILQERDINLTRLAQQTDFPGIWGGLSSERQGSTSSFYGFDSQNSTRILVDIGGSVTDSYSYKAFGEEFASGSGTANPYRYIGLYGYFHDSITRTYLRQRYYKPVDGRFISYDPADLVVGTNLFAYVNNQAVIASDPSGLCQVCGPPRISKSFELVARLDDRFKEIVGPHQDIAIFIGNYEVLNWKSVCTLPNVPPPT